MEKNCRVCGKKVETEESVCPRCNEVTNKTNRSFGQTKFLLNLLGNNFNKLLELEEKIRNNFVFYCPGDLESVNEIMKFKGDRGFNLNEFKS